MRWTTEALGEIARADDLHIAPYREDGSSPGTLTWIWSVAVDGDLYVRAYNGPRSRWHQAAIRQGAGVIRAAGKLRQVTFEPVEGPLQARIDDAYRSKYKGSPYLGAMISARAQGATIRILPAGEGTETDGGAP